MQPGIPGYDFALELQPEIDGYNSVRQSCSYDFVATTLTKVVAVFVAMTLRIAKFMPLNFWLSLGLKVVAMNLRLQLCQKW